MRCFVAIDLDESLKQRVIDLQRRIKGDVKLVDPHNLHFTVKFLGEVDSKKLDKAISILRGLHFEPFNVNIKGICIFPNKRFIKVVWLGCSDLLPLYKLVEDALSPLFGAEESVPHLTLARVRYRSQEIENFVNANQDVEVGDMRVSNIKIKKSTLTRKGPVYEDIEVFGKQK
jgi:2'-5' RNA ligase